jgi:hypothetical protein
VLILIYNDGKQADKIPSLQAGIVKYLNAVQFASWNVLKKNIDNLYAISFDESSPIENLEYKVLYPLLRSGIIETARRPETDKLVYCLGSEVIIEMENNQAIEIIPIQNICRVIEHIQEKNPKKNKVKKEDSLLLLRSMPSLHAVITHWKNSTTEVYFIYERFESNHFKYAQDSSLPNIYTNQDKIYSNRYIRTENKSLYLIPEIEDNIDSLNIALCYLEIIKKHSHFAFNENDKELTCWTFHRMLPFVICRALILCDPMMLIDSRMYNNGTVIIRNITNDHIKELKRIFGDTAVETKK